MSKPYGRDSDKMTLTPDLPTQDELNITLFELVEINFEDFPASSRFKQSFIVLLYAFFLDLALAHHNNEP